MRLYKDIHGDSNIESYETGADYIWVKFKAGYTYLYNYAHTGIEHIEQMKILAANGDGLNTFINKYVTKSYAYKKLSLVIKVELGSPVY